MENNANYAFVGALFVAIVVALFGFVYWFANPGADSATKSYNIVFKGAVSGIGRGTDVTFNGIRVGQVTEIDIDPNDANRVVARISVGADTPVKADTRAVSGFTGLTGAGSVQMSGGSTNAGEPPVLEGDDVPTLYAESSDVQSVIDGLATTLSGASQAVDRLNGFLDSNSSKLDATISNLETFSGALASNSDGVEAFMNSVGELGDQLEPAITEISSLSAELRKLVEAVPPEQVSSIVSNANTFTESLSRNSAQIDSVLAEAGTLVTDLKASVAVINEVTANVDPEAVGRVVANVDRVTEELNTRLGPTLDELSGLSSDIRAVVAAVPPEQVKTIVANVNTFSETLSRNSGTVDTVLADAGTLLANLNDMSGGLKESLVVIEQVVAEIDPAQIGRVVDNVDSFSQRLGNNADNVDEIIANIKSVSATLESSAGQVQSILDRVDGLVANADGQGLFDDLAAAARSVRELADDLNDHAGSIASGLDDFANRGLPEYGALASDARATLRRLDRVVRNLEANPQSLVFGGGETVREYNKQ